MTGRVGLVAALVVALRHGQPFAVPALPVSGDHPARGLEAFADGTTALLGLAQSPAELVSHPWLRWPVVPAVRLIVSRLVLRQLLDRAIRDRHGASSWRAGLFA